MASGYAGKRNYRSDTIERAISDAIRDRFHLISGTVVDVGCGRAPYRPLLDARQTRYIGVDIDPDVEPDIVASMMNLPLEADVADVVLCIGVLSYAAEPVRALREARRVLKTHGYLILVESQNGRYQGPPDYFRFTPDGLREVATRAGLEVVTAAPRGGFFASVTAKSATYAAEVAARRPRSRRVAPPVLNVYEALGRWADRRYTYVRDPLMVDLVARKP